MIVVDIEATGTDFLKHSIVSIGAIDFGHPDIQFYEECKIWEGAHIDHNALNINGFSEDSVRNKEKKSEAEIVELFIKWALEREDHTVAGQNPLFDVGFIKAASERSHLDYPLAHRSIDLHTMVYYHMIRRGLTPPLANRRTNIDSDKIMEYVGIHPEPKPHKALNGAIWEAEAFSRLLYEKCLFEQFKDFLIPWLM